MMLHGSLALSNCHILSTCNTLIPRITDYFIRDCAEFTVRYNWKIKSLLRSILLTIEPQNPLTLSYFLDITLINLLCLLLQTIQLLEIFLKEIVN